MTHQVGQKVIIWAFPLEEKGKARKATLLRFLSHDGIIEKWEATVLLENEEVFSVVEIRSIPTGEESLFLF